MMKKVCVAVFVLAWAGMSFAEGTRLWKESDYDEFERGTTKGIAIRSSGQIELAPIFKPIYTSPSTFIWGIAADKDGGIYVATGAPARVYRVTPDGKSQVIFEPKELQVQAVTVGKDGAIYAATSPDGKVYRISRSATRSAPGAAPDFTSSVFFDPKTKYIWDMAFDQQGRLYVATGDNGEIFRVDQNGAGAVFFKSDEAHIRVLAFAPNGNLIAGSDGSGLVYRVSPAGEGFVLYSAPKKEITALAVDAAGNIYAAGTGEKHGGPAPLPAGQPILVNPAQPGGPNPPQVGMANLAGSEIYMLAPDGAPKKLWSSRDDIVYALAFDPSGRLIAGTGNRGRIFAIEKSGEFVDLLRASANQVTAFTKGPNNTLYCSSSNLGKVFALGSTPEPEGSLESDVQDVHIFSRWGRAEVRGHGNFELYARSGNVDNPDRNWSPWSKVDLGHDARLEVPAARFIQWRAVLKPANPPTQVEEVGINYLSRNVAPVIDEVGVQVGARVQPQTHITGPESFTLMPGVPPPLVQQHNDVPITAFRDKSFVAVRWTAHDDNDDNLSFSVYYRGDNEQDWKLLKSGLGDRAYSFDSALLPDGGYTVKIIASDAPSHSNEDALTDEKQSRRFELDNTPPRIENLAARTELQGVHVTFHAADDRSPIKRAEYSVDAGDWQYVEPVGALSDAKAENYDFTVPLTAPQSSLEEQAEQKRGKTKAAPAPVPAQEHVVVVRVYDRNDNMASAKYVAR